MQLFTFPQKYSALTCLISTSEDGPLPTSTNLEQSSWRANREAFLERNGILGDNVVAARLEHGTNITAVKRQDGGKIFSATDGLSTREGNLWLAVTVADCVPIYFYDPVHRAVAILHAGWRGLAEKFPTKMVDHLVKTYSAAPRSLIVGLGPAIGPCHYDVGDDVVETFADYPDAVQRRGDREYLDLHAVAKHQLLAAGVAASLIQDDRRCTFEDPQLFSYRRDKDLDRGVMMAVIGLRPNR